MLVKLFAPGVPSSEYDFQPDVCTDYLLDRFCGQHSLRRELCYIFFQGRCLDGSEPLHTLLREQKSLAPASAEESALQLHAITLPPSLDSFIWHTLIHSKVFDGTGVYIDWKCHVEGLVSHGGLLAGMFDDKPLLRSFLAISPTKQLPASSLSQPLDQAVSSGLLQVPDAMQPVITLLQELTSDRPKASTDAFLKQQETRIAQARRGAGQATQLSSAASVAATSSSSSSSSTTASAVQQQATETAPSMVFLRSAVLLLKLASLVDPICMACPDPDASTKVNMLFKALEVAGVSWQNQHGTNTAYHACPPPLSDAEIAEEHFLASCLWRLMLPTIHRGAKLKSLTAVDVCCTILQQLLVLNDGLAFAEYFRRDLGAGLIPLLTLVTERYRTGGMVVLHVLHRLMTSDCFEAEQRLQSWRGFTQAQGLRRSSMLLCPAVDPSEPVLFTDVKLHFSTNMAKQGVSLKKLEAKDVRDEVQRLQNVVRFILKYLKHKPALVGQPLPAAQELKQASSVASDSACDITLQHDSLDRETDQLRTTLSSAQLPSTQQNKSLIPIPELSAGVAIVQQSEGTAPVCESSVELPNAQHNKNSGLPIQSSADLPRVQYNEDLMPAPELSADAPNVQQNEDSITPPQSAELHRTQRHEDSTPVPELSAGVPKIQHNNDSAPTHESPAEPGSAQPPKAQHNEKSTPSPQSSADLPKAQQSEGLTPAPQSSVDLLSFKPNEDSGHLSQSSAALPTIQPKQDLTPTPGSSAELLKTQPKEGSRPAPESATQLDVAQTPAWADASTLVNRLAVVLEFLEAYQAPASAGLLTLVHELLYVLLMKPLGDPSVVMHVVFGQVFWAVLKNGRQGVRDNNWLKLVKAMLTRLAASPVLAGTLPLGGAQDTVEYPAVMGIWQALCHWLEQGDSAVALAANALCMLTNFNGHIDAAYSSLGPFHKSAYKQLYEPVRLLHGTAAGLNMLAFMFLIRETQYKQQPPVNDPADPEIEYISNARLLAATLWPFAEDKVDNVWPDTVYAALIRLFGACLKEHCFPSQDLCKVLKDTDLLFTVLVQLLPRLKNAPRRIVPALLHRYLYFASKWMGQVLFYHGERLVNEDMISIMFAAQPWVCSASASEVDSSVYESPGQHAAENPERNPEMLLQLTMDMCIITGTYYNCNGQHLIELWAHVWLDRMHDFLKSLYLESNSERQYSEQGQQPIPDYLPRAYINITFTVADEASKLDPTPAGQESAQPSSLMETVAEAFVKTILATVMQLAHIKHTSGFLPEGGQNPSSKAGRNSSGSSSNATNRRIAARSRLQALSMQHSRQAHASEAAKETLGYLERIFEGTGVLINMPSCKLFLKHEGARCWVTAKHTHEWLRNLLHEVSAPPMELPRHLARCVEVLLLASDEGGAPSSTAYAEQLLEEEEEAAARAAAKTAAKKVKKKQRQKAKKQQTAAADGTAEVAAQLPSSLLLHSTQGTAEAVAQPSSSPLLHSTDRIAEAAAQPPSSTLLHSTEDIAETAAQPLSSPRPQGTEEDARNAASSTYGALQDVNGLTVQQHNAELPVSADSERRPNSAVQYSGFGHASAAVQTAFAQTAQSESKSSGGQGIFVMPPDIFCCPITKVDMVDPVIAADGSTYERTAIEQWLQQHDTSPVTGVALAHTRLVPNIVIRQAITYQQQQQWE